MKRLSGCTSIESSRSDAFDWIRLHRLEPRRERSFGPQYRTFMSGYEMIRHLPLDFVPALDAGISFESPDYFRSLLTEFGANAPVGVAVGLICENQDGVFKGRRVNVFGLLPVRSRCFDEKCSRRLEATRFGRWCNGALVVVMAEMKGWEVQSVFGRGCCTIRPLHGGRPSARRVSAGVLWTLAIAILPFLRV